MNIDQMIERLRSEPFCTLRPRTGDFALPPGPPLPEDVSAFYRAFAGGDIYANRRGDGFTKDGPEDPANGWELYADPFAKNANEDNSLGPENLRTEYHDRCYILGSQCEEWRNRLCIDLNPSAQYGWIFIEVGEGHGMMSVSAPVVAKSFT